MSQPAPHSQHEARICWRREPTETFTDLRYCRAHRWEFDGGSVIAASSAVSSVPPPYSRPQNVDPEEALVAAAASCHMLSFLALAARGGLVVDTYEDRAMGTMGRNERGRLALTRVELAPRIVFAGPKAPNETEVQHLHHLAHEECYIANSLTATISVRCAWSYVT